MIPLFAAIDPDIVALFIPILMVLGGVAIAIFAIVNGSRRRELEHRERLAAIEKGLPLPEPPMEQPRLKYSSRRAAGLTLVAIGLALVIAISANEGLGDGLWGLIPLFMGIGLLMAAAADRRDYERFVASRESSRESGMGAARHATTAPAASGAHGAAYDEPAGDA